jgi:RNA-directed DNA polymerase
LSRAGRQEPVRRREPCSGEQARGPQHQVKPAASTEKQCESRAAHVTAKATLNAPGSGQIRAWSLAGVEGAARVQGEARNTRDPSGQPESGTSASHKPKVKASAAQRESEGTVVVAMVATNNATGAKGPCGGQVEGAGKREGMAGDSGPNHPGGRESAAKVRQLQLRLGEAAKQQRERRFHALYDRIYRCDVLWEAWRRVKRNKGAAGVDAVTLDAIEKRGVDQLIEELHVALRAGTYRPSAVLRRYIPKTDGKRRPLGIPTVRDRIVQAATKLVLEPIFEADFQSSSYGFRPGRSATDALETLRKKAVRGGNWVLDADIRDYFGSIDHELLLERVGRRVTDRRVLKLLRQWLKAGVMEEGRETTTLSGTPQGGVISPLLSNVYLSFLDNVWQRRCAQLGTLVRYADDFVVMCETKSACEEAERRVKIILARLKLELHPEKTRKVELTRGRDGFDFLGCHLHKRMSGPMWERYGKAYYYLHRWPSTRSMKRVRQRLNELTSSSRNGVKDVRDIIADLNPVLRGWGNYFRTGNAATKFLALDAYVEGRLHRFLVRRKGRHLRPREAQGWTRDFFEGHGLVRLRGTIRYPEAA